MNMVPDNIPWWVAIPLAVVLFVVWLRLRAIDKKRGK